MRTTLRLHSINDRGGILAVALVMTAIVGIVLTGWVAIASNHALNSRIGEDAARRRLMMESTRGYTRQMMQQTFFSGASTKSLGTTGEIDPSGASGTGWGAFQLTTGWASMNFFDLPPTVKYPSLGNDDKVFPYNAFGLRPGASFRSTQTMTRPATYNPADPDSTLMRLDAYDGYIFAKGIFPTLSGDTFVIYKKPERESGEIVIDANFYIDGRLTVRDPASLFNSATVNLGAKVRIGARSTVLNVQKADPTNRVTGTSNGKYAPASPVFQPSAGLELMPSNFPATPSTFGSFPRPSGGAPTTNELYRGELNIIKNDYVPTGSPVGTTQHPNCLWAIQDRDATSTPVRAAVQTISVGTAVGTTTDPYWIEDQTSPTYPPPAWPSGYPPVWKVLFINLQHVSLTNLRIYGVVHQVVFLGQTTTAEYNAAASMDPRSIVIIPDIGSRAVQDIRFIRENNRPFVLGVKGDVRQPLGLYWMGTNINTTATVIDWRMTLINEYRQITCTLPTGGGATNLIMYGGVVTNWSFERYDSGAADQFKIAPDPLCAWDTVSGVYKLATTSGYNFASSLPREAWVEPFFNLDPPP